jgi:hypothetical protein
MWEVAGGVFIGGLGLGVVAWAVFWAVALLRRDDDLEDGRAPSAHRLYRLAQHQVKPAPEPTLANRAPPE